MKPRHVSRGSVLALLLIGGASAIGACSSSEKVGNTGGSGGAKSTGKGGSTGTGAGGSTGTTGAGGSSATTGAGGATTTTGAGGAVTTTGAGGAGGSAVVQKDCAMKTTLMNPVLLNFESYDGVASPASFGAAFGGPTPNTGTAYTGPFA